MEVNAKDVDPVFEGGGVKGIALAGALSVLEERGYLPQNTAGASAGAIVAALLVAGYGAGELKSIIAGPDYGRFEDGSLEDRFPLAGPSTSILKDLKVYEGEWFLGSGCANCSKERACAPSSTLSAARPTTSGTATARRS